LVDAFLQKRPDVLECGKLVLAYELCLRERPDELIPPVDDDWYAHLWQRMSDGVGDPQHVANRLRIVTFNYDRSLEYRLHQAFKGTYKLDDAQALQCVSQISILHLYGTIGRFHYLGGRGTRSYSPNLVHEQLRTAMDALKVIPEHRDNDDFQVARRWFDWADHIGIMGFSFDPTNCDRLGLDSVLQFCKEKRRQEKTILASIVGLTPAEVLAAKRRMCPTQDWTTIDRRNLQFLRHTDLLA